ncbi:MAG: hypothetical protein IK144_07575 [Bacteroidaceae bacterium]|nr:hypothetical protein [Bacteroidaceae bacterium]
MKRVIHFLIALVAIVGSANAQNLSFEVQANEAKISLTGATEMTALQFNMKLPEGVNVNTNDATLGSATDGHTLCIETLDNGDLLFILYSMDLNPFKDGELLRLPVNGALGDASLYIIRYADADAVSHEAEDIVTGISLTPTLSKGEGAIYNVSGQRLNKLQKGININDGKKVLVK